MKELTAAQGLLRCGECDTIFDAMKSLSTTLPEERRFAPTGNAAENNLAEVLTTNKLSETEFDKGFFSKKSAHAAANKSATQAHYQHHPRRVFTSRLLLIIGVTALALLLLLQLAYSSRNWLAKYPLTANMTRQLCSTLGCEIRLPRDLQKINLLSRNVYSHPNTPGVLTISLSIQNEAVFAQPYPLVEISFLDKNNNVMALRRFTPGEYIKDFQDEPIQPNVPTELLLNISDPGSEAVRFQFRFM
jgi:hypothetical protein